MIKSGLPRNTQGTQGIFKLKKISGRLRETQGTLIYFLNLQKLNEVLIFLKSSGKFSDFKNSRKFFLLYLE